MWDLSCPDWQARLRDGRPLIPDLPLIESEARMGLQFFDELQLPDVPDKPKLRDACGDWFRGIVLAAAGSWDPESRTRHIREIFVLAPKGSSKTSYSAGLLVSTMLMNKRPRAEALFVGPTQAISERAYDQAAGMISASPELRKRFQAIDHLKTIKDRINESELKVKTFSVDILTGSIPMFVLLDELHLLGNNPHAERVLRQIRGGLNKTPEGMLLITTTQSDGIPHGVFRDELIQARMIRDRKIDGATIRPTLPILYEFPDDIARDQAKWEDPASWPMVMPNLGRSIHLKDLVLDWQTERRKGDHAIKVWASQHLNIEIGIGLKHDNWPGAEFWAEAVDETLALETLLLRCEVIVVGIDGGGLDDLFGLTVLGRERGSKRWLSWSHAWCATSVLKRRQTIAATLEGLAADDELTIVDDKIDYTNQVVALIERVNDAGLLHSVAIDTEGPYGELVDALDLIGINEESEQIVGIGQGYKLMGAIKTTERKLANGTLVHAPSRLMDWCVSNIKIEPTATAIRATKQNAGDAKIDPAMALFDAATVMIRNPEPGGSVYTADRGLLIFDVA